MIDESEICKDYQHAKNKAAQVSILADLYVTTPVKIRDILEHNGFIVESMETTASGITRTRKRWTPDMIEEIAKLWADGATADELAQQYQTTISAILGLQHRNKKLFDHYLSQPVPEPQPTAPTEVTEVAQGAVQEEPMVVAPEEKPPMISEGSCRQIKIPPSVAGAKLNNVGLLLSHAKTLQQSAQEALSEGRDIDCAYVLGELSQVLIRAKETAQN